MQKFYLHSDYLKYINLYAGREIFDDNLLIRLCKIAADNRLYSVSVPWEHVRDAWNWLQMSDVQLCGLVNNYMNNLSLDEVYKCIKNSFSFGADIVEVILSPVMFDLKNNSVSSLAVEYLSAIGEAKSNKVKKIKVVVESSFIKSQKSLELLVSIFNKYKIDIIKTASGLYSSSSSIIDCYTMLEVSKELNIGVDFLFDESIKDYFVIDDGCRLYESFSEKNLQSNKNFCVSCSVASFKNIVNKLSS